MAVVLGNTVAVILVLALVWVCAGQLWKDHKSGGSCAGCGGCGGSCGGSCAGCRGCAHKQ